MGEQAFEKILSSKLESYEKDGAGKHFDRLNAINTLREFYGGQALIAVFDLPFVILFFCLIAVLGGWIVVVPLIIIAGFAFSARARIKKLREIILKRRATDDQRMNFMIQSLSGIHTIKAMAMEAQILRRYERLQKAALKNDYELSENSSGLIGFSATATQMATTFMVVFGSIAVIHQNMTIGALAACILLIGRIFTPINKALSVWSRLQSIKIARAQFNEINLMEFERSEAPDFPKIKGDIEFKHISFAYQSGHHFVLKDVNFSVKQGECIAITGDSLSGKSTLLNLLMLGLEPSSGEILIDQHQISKYNPGSIRAQINYSVENGVLFDGTILENLTMFQTKVQQVEKIKAICKELGLDEIISHLPQGYDTQVGNRSVEIIRAGSLQRICIARAFLNDSSIVVIDEGMSSIDHHSDKLLIQFLRKFKGNKTVIIAAMRPSYLHLADRVYTLNNGNLILKSEV